MCTIPTSIKYCSCPPGCAVNAGHETRVASRAARVLALLQEAGGELTIPALRQAYGRENGFAEALAALLKRNQIQRSGLSGTPSAGYRLL